MTRLAIPVHSTAVSSVWHQALPFIERALAEGNGGHDAADVLDLLESSEAQLWMGTHEGALEMVAVTEIVLRPQMKVARVWLLAGSEAPEWIAERLSAIEAWARDEGCRHLEMIGRKGWLKRLPGWSPVQVVMSKELRP